MNIQGLNSPEWANIVHALLHTLWQGVAAAALLGLALRSLRNPVARYRCSLGALVVVVFAGFVTWAASSHPVIRSGSDQIVPQEESSASTTGSIQPSNPPALQPAASATAPADNHWIAWIALAWLAGGTAMIIRAAIQISGAEGLRRTARPLDDERIAALLAESRRAIGLTRRVQIAVTDKLTSPAVVGVIMPTLILPLSLISALTPEQIRFVLLHELAHIQRGDYFASLFQLLVEALLFFNPAVWWISRHIRIEREACCDALAVELSRAPAEYARTLVQVAETMLTPLPQAALAFGEEKRGSSLADRVQRMLVPGYRPKLRLTWRGALVALLAGGGLFLLSAIGTQLTVAALTPQQRIARIEKKMAEYGERPIPTDRGNLENVAVTAHLRIPDGSRLPRQRTATIQSIRPHASAGYGVWIGQDGTISNNTSPGQIWIEADVNGFAPFIAGPFDGTATNRIDAGDLALNTGFDVPLRVSDATSGAPIPNAVLQAQFIFRDNGHSFQRLDKGQSDGDGILLLHHCGDYRIHVTVNAPGFEITELNFERLAAGKTLEVKLNRGAEVSGTVIDKMTGQGIANATIRIICENESGDGRYSWDDEMHWLARADAEGHFTTLQLRHGTVYWLGVAAPGHESVFVGKVLTGTKNLIVKLGPALIIRGHVIGDLDGLYKVNGIPNILCNRSEVIENNSYGDGFNVPVQVTDGVATFLFTNRMAGSISLSGAGYEERRDVRAPIDDWVVDLSQTKAKSAEALPKREVVFRFTHPAGVVPRGIVAVQIPDNLEENHRTAHFADLEITNGEVRANIAIGGTTSVKPEQMVGFWFDPVGKYGHLLVIAVTNGPGPMVIEIPLLPAGAIYAKARNADGSPAGENLFGLRVLQQAPGMEGTSPLNSSDGLINGNDAHKWAAGPLPLGGTYQVHTWRGNTFAVSKPIKLTEANPDAEVELQFAPGASCDGVVLDPDGKPLAGAPLLMTFNLPEDLLFGLSSLITDENGKFHLENATPDVGDYTAQVNAPGFAAESVKLKFAGRPQTIRLQRGLSLAGRVVEARTGYVIPGAKVRAADLDRNKFPQQEVTADADGRFAFDTLGDVNYTISVQGAEPLPDKKYFPDGRTNLVLSAKLYEWSQIKAVPPASGPQAKRP